MDIESQKHSTAKFSEKRSTITFNKIKSSCKKWVLTHVLDR